MKLDKPASPGVSVAVCAFNGARRLPKTIAHVLSQDVPDHIQWEVLIIDNASDDDTSEVAQSLRPPGARIPYRVIREPVQGVQNARRRALVESRYDFLCLVDDDNWLHSNYVQTLYNVLVEHPEVAVCGGDIELPGNIKAPDWFERYQTSYAVGKQGHAKGHLPVDKAQIWGAGMGLRKAAWKELIEAGFDQILHGRVGKGMMPGEETELCLALRLAGWELWYDPDLKLEHAVDPARFTWRYLRRNCRGGGASHVWLDLYFDLLNVPTGRIAVTDRWYVVFFSELRKLMDRLPQAFLAWMNVPGSPKAIKYEIRVGFLQEVLRNRKRYGKIVRELKAAQWIKRQPGGESFQV